MVMASMPQILVATGQVPHKQQMQMQGSSASVHVPFTMHVLCPVDPADTLR